MLLRLSLLPFWGLFRRLACVYVVEYALTDHRPTQLKFISWFRNNLQRIVLGGDLRVFADAFVWIEIVLKGLLKSCRILLKRDLDRSIVFNIHSLLRLLELLHLLFCPFPKVLEILGVVSHLVEVFCEIVFVFSHLVFYLCKFLHELRFHLLHHLLLSGLGKGRNLVVWLLASRLT